MEQPLPPYLHEDYYRQRLGLGPNFMDPPRAFHGHEVGNRMQPGPPKERRIIWGGTMDWLGKATDDPRMRTSRTYNCQISSNVGLNGEPEVFAELWPRRLVMQLIPRHTVRACENFLANSRQIFFHLDTNPEDLLPLNESMSNGFAGCILLTPNESNIRVIILWYNQLRRTYVGFLAHDQHGLVNAIRHAASTHKVRRPNDNFKPVRPIPPNQHLPVPPWGHAIQQQPQQVLPPEQKVEGWLTHTYPYGGPSTSATGQTPGRFADYNLCPMQLASGSPMKRKRTEDGSSPASKSMKVTKQAASIIDETFSCIVCQGPMRHPVVTNCCNSLVACKKCYRDWASESNSCLKCRAVNPVYTEVLGLHEGIGALKDCGFFD